MSVYTLQLFVGQLPASWAEFYTVPAGRKQVLIDMEIEVGTASSSPLLMSLQKASGGSGIFFARATLPANNSLQWTGRVALNPGDQLWANAAVANVGAILTGYDFNAT